MPKSDQVPKFWPTSLLPLNQPARHLWRFGSALIVPTVGLLSRLWLNYLNRVKIINHNIFLDATSRNLKEKKHPLITVSNHNSCLDDPLLWGSLFPTLWHLNSNRHRWSPAAEDICFTRWWHTVFFVFGKTFPVIRGKGIHQPAMDFAVHLLKQNEFLHVFPQGKVVEDADLKDSATLKKSVDQMQLVDPEDAAKPYQLKWGLARLIIDTLDNTEGSGRVEILPFYHIGMNTVLPNVQPYIPRRNKKVTIYFRDEGPILFDKKFITDKCCSGNATLSIPDQRIRIMNYLEKELKSLKLKCLEAHKFYSSM